MIHTLPVDLQNLIYTRLPANDRIRMFLALPKSTGRVLYNKERERNLHIASKFFSKNVNGFTPKHLVTFVKSNRDDVLISNFIHFIQCTRLYDDIVMNVIDPSPDAYKDIHMNEDAVQCRIAECLTLENFLRIINKPHLCRQIFDDQHPLFMFYLVNYKNVDILNYITQNIIPDFEHYKMTSIKQLSMCLHSFYDSIERLCILEQYLPDVFYSGLFLVHERAIDSFNVESALYLESILKKQKMS